MKFVLFILIILLASCSDKKTDSKVDSLNVRAEAQLLQTPKLYINTSVADATLGKNDMKKRDSISIVTSDYFEITLEVMGDLKTYRGRKEIEQTVVGQKFHSVDISITDEKGEELAFNGTTAFLNFMSAHGYSMVDQTKTKYHTDYTFKKK